jgi:hypothetical protein
MTTWIAVYRGDSVPTAKVIAVSSEPSLVRSVARRLLLASEESPDPVMDASDAGRRTALRLVAESKDD